MMIPSIPKKKFPPAAARWSSENQNHTSEYGQCIPAITFETDLENPCIACIFTLRYDANVLGRFFLLQKMSIQDTDKLSIAGGVPAVEAKEVAAGVSEAVEWRY